MTSFQQPMPEIISQLKKIRLSGFMESLPMRNKEAISGKLSYPEFLSLLLRDEILRRENKKFKERIRQSGFVGEKTIERFDFGFNPKIDQRLIKELSTVNFIAENVPVLIVGPCGTGKSHLAQAIGHCSIRCGYDVIFINQSKLFKELQIARATGTHNKVFKKFVKTKLLIIDDFGLKPLTPPQDEDLHDIIVDRYERAPTIITSNLHFDEWQDAFPNKLLGAATIDRLMHNAYKVILDGESYRSINRKNNQNSTLKTT